MAQVRHRRAVAGCLIAVLVMSSACTPPPVPGGGENGSAQAEPSIGSVDSIDRPEQIVLPLSRYEVSVGDLQRLASIEARLITDCMQEHGVPGEWKTLPGIPNWIDHARSSRLTLSKTWGFFSPATVSTQGYGVPQNGSAGGEEGPSVPGVDPDQVTSCLTDVELSMPLHNGWSNFIAYSGLPNGGPQIPESDSRLVAAQTSWSGCMQSHGYRYNDVVEAALSFDRAAGSPPTAAEISAATADIACKAQTNLVGIAVAVESAYELRYIEQNHNALDDLRQSVQTFIRDNS